MVAWNEVSNTAYWPSSGRAARRCSTRSSARGWWSGARSLSPTELGQQLVVDARRGLVVSALHHSVDDDVEFAGVGECLLERLVRAGLTRVRVVDQRELER